MKILLVVFAIFGLTYGSQTKDLNQDLQDFIALIPIAEIETIVLDHVANDSEFQNLMNYLMSPEFQTIVYTLDNTTEFIDLLNYIQASGFDIYSYVNMMHQYLGLPPLTPPAPRRHRSWASMMDEIEALIPVDQLVALFEYKLQNSPDFQAFVARIQSPEFQVITNTLVNLPEYQALKQKLRDYGVDIDRYINFLKELFGLPTTPQKENKDLNQDLQDFLALIPVVEIETIVLDHLANDTEFQNLMNYLMSPEFQTIVYTLDNTTEFIDLLNYIQASGFDIYSYVNMMHQYLGLPPLTPPAPRRHRSWASMMDEIEALIPVDQLVALFEYKLQNSPDFQAFVARIQSPEFQVITDTLVNLPEYQAMKQKLRDYGVDIDRYINFLKELFGLTGAKKM